MQDVLLIQNVHRKGARISSLELKQGATAVMTGLQPVKLQDDC